MDWRRARELFERVGEKRFTMEMINRINDPKFNTAEFSLKGLYEAVGSPNLKREQEIGNRLLKESDFEVHESLDSTTFPKITGALINKVIQEAYKIEYGAGMELVTVIPSSVKDETIVGFADDDELREVGEGVDYEAGAITEKYHKIMNRKWGRIVALTEEMIKFDQTGQMMARARRVGEQAAASQDKEIFDKVLGLTNSGDYAAWRPAGTATTLYSDTSADPYTTATLDNLIADVLADETDLDSANLNASTFTDEAGSPMAWNPKILLVGGPLQGTALKIANSRTSQVAAANSGVINPWYDRGLRVVVSNRVNIGVAATTWLIGDFKKQFVFTEVFPLQTFQARPGSEAEFNRDVIYQVKARWMGGCGAITNRYVIKATS